MLDRLEDIVHGCMMMFCFSISFYFFFCKLDERLPHRVRHAFGSILIVLFLLTIVWFYASFSSSVSLDNKQMVMLNLLVAPFIVFFFMELTRACRVTIKIVAGHFGLSLLMCLSYVIVRDSLGQEFSKLYYMMYILCACVYIIICGVYVYIAGRRYNRIIENVYADLEGRTINWLGHIMFIIIALFIFFIVCHVISFEYYGSTIAHILFFPMTIILLGRMALYVNEMKVVEAVPYLSELTKEDQHAEDMEEEHILVKGASGADKESSLDGKLPMLEGDNYENLDEEHAKFMSQMEEVCIEEKLFCKQGITREDVAKALKTNHIRLTRMLKESTGLTFSAYIGRIRLEQAAKMLLETDATVEQIFYTCGYRTRSTFNRAFTEAYGCTPKEFRTQKG